MKKIIITLTLLISPALFAADFCAIKTRTNAYPGFAAESFCNNSTNLSKYSGKRLEALAKLVGEYLDQGYEFLPVPNNEKEAIFFLVKK